MKQLNKAFTYEMDRIGVLTPANSRNSSAREQFRAIRINAATALASKLGGVKH